MRTRVAGASFTLAVVVLLLCISAVAAPSTPARADEPADLQITKMNNASGEVRVGDAFTWSLTVTNPSAVDATFTAGQTILVDNLPAGATYSGATVELVDNVNGQPNIDCSLIGNDLTCVANGGDVTIGGTTGTFSVSLIAQTTAAGTLVNPRADGICRVDPAAVVAESDESNNDCTDTVAVTQPNLQVSKVNDVGGTTAPVHSEITWTWTITNAGTGPANFANGNVLLRENLPNGGETYGTPTPGGYVNVSGSNRIACEIVNDDLTCKANNGPVTIAAGGRFEVRVTVTANVPGTLTSPRQSGQCAVDPDGVVAESNEADNSCSDVITILGPELTVTKTNDVGGATTVGTPWTWTWTVKNTGTYRATFANNQTVLFDQLPTGAVTYGEATVSNTVNVSGAGQVSCSITNDDLVCVASNGPVIIGETTGSFTVTATVTPTAGGTFTNPRSSGVCLVDRNDHAKEYDESNNACTDTVIVSSAPPDLRVTKGSGVSGAVTVGSTFTWALTVANTGSGTATFADGQAILVDDLPSGANYENPTIDAGAVGVTGAENIACAVVSDSLTCTATGGSVAIDGTTGTFTVSVPVTPTVAGALNNPRSGGTCKVDPTGPNGVIAETDETNNTCSASVTVVSKPDLKVTKVNNVAGLATEGTSWTWTWDVQNVGGSDATFASVENVLLDLLPTSGLVFGEPTISNTVNVGGSGTLTCARQGMSASPHLICAATNGTVVLGVNGGFRVSLTVTDPQPGAYQSSFCAVDPDGVVAEGDEANNGCGDAVAVAALPSDLQVTKTNTVGGSTTLGEPFDWKIVVTNVGSGDAKFQANDIILIDNLPAGLSVLTPVVSNTNLLPGSTAVNCALSGPVSGAFTLLCRASSAETMIPREGGGFTVTLQVTPTMAGAFVNPRPDADPGCMADPTAVLTETTLTNNTCADTVNVTSPQPDLRIGASNDTSSAATVGTAFTWSLTVANGGSGDATFSHGQTIFTSDLPTAGATYESPSLVPGSTGVTGTEHIDCAVLGNVLTCTATNGDVTIAGTTGTFTVNLPVTPTVAGTLKNPRDGGACTVDPAGLLSESNEANNVCGPDTVTVTGTPNLQVVLSTAGGPTAVVGNEFAWTWTIANVGSGPATFAAGQTILFDNLPSSGATYKAPAIGGSTDVVGIGNLICAVVADNLTCTVQGGSVTLAAATGTFQVTVLTTPTEAGALANPRDGGVCTVDPDGAIAESSEGDNGCAQTVTVVAPADLRVTASNNVSGSSVVGTPWTWSWVIANSGGSATFTDGTPILVSHLPSSDLTYGTPGTSSPVNVTGTVSCTIVTANLTCTASGGTVVIGDNGSITVTVSVTPTAPGTFVTPRTGGQCAVDPSLVISEGNEANNTCTDSVLVAPTSQPELKVQATNDVGGSATVGTRFTWTLTVTNTGAAAIFSQDQQILVDDLPLSGATYGAPQVGSLSGITNGNNLRCTVDAGVLSCIADGGSVTLGATTGSFAVTLPVTPTAIGALANPRVPGFCMVDQTNVVAETDESNNHCSDSVTVSAAPQPDLRVTATNSTGGTATVGGAFDWTLTIVNAGTAPATFASGQTILADHLPSSGATYLAPTVGSLVGVSGGGTVSCGVSGANLVCTAVGGTVMLGAGSGSLKVTLPVRPTAAGPLANPRAGGVCAVDPNGAVAESTESNNQCADTVTIASPPAAPPVPTPVPTAPPIPPATPVVPAAPEPVVPDLRIVATGPSTASVAIGSTFTWTLAVTNTGTGPAVFSSGQPILVDHLPNGGATYGAPAVGGVANVAGAGNIQCAVASNTLTCTADGGSVALGAGNGAFTVAVPVTSTIMGTLANPRADGICAVDPTGVVAESNEGNNTCGNGVTVGRPPVTVATSRAAPGTLSVTITATGPANSLREIRVGNVTNATVRIADQTGGTGLQVPLPATPTSIVVTVTRASPGTMVHVPLVIVDQYGEWPTFVGGGPDSF